MADLAEKTDDKPKLGIFYDIPEDVYHSSPGISKHGLDKINQSGAHYKFAPDVDSNNFVFGRAAHCAILEPDKFEKTFTISPYPDFRKKEAREWKTNAIENGVQILSVADYNKILAMRDKLRSHFGANSILDLSLGKAEVSMYWIDDNKPLWGYDDTKPTYRLCRGRADFYNEYYDFLVDYKTCACAGETDFGYDSDKYRYHVQAAFYSYGARQCGLDVKEFVFVAQEKEPPYEIGLYYATQEQIELGETLFKRNLTKYHEMMKANEWPGYDEKLRPLIMPARMRYPKTY